MVKTDETYNSFVKSGATPAGLMFRPVTFSDSSTIIKLLQERNPNIESSRILSKTKQDIERVQIDPNYKVYVADLNDEVIGFCRFSHTTSMSEKYKLNPSPHGWYGLGILVDPKFRRQNVARFISRGRVEVLKTMSINEIYSIVDSNNLASIRMHQEFGYTEISRAPGYLHFDFSDRLGILFKMAF